MSRGTLAELATTVQGTLQGSDAGFDGVSTDTRKLMAGELFVALHGPTFDGHRFVSRAGDMGAAGALTQRHVDADLPQVVTADSRLALGRMAAAWRARFTLPVVGITGSNGKTSVKEMTAAILSCRFTTLATQGNLNNDIGVPLTLLRLEAVHHAAVVEMGANHVGEIAQLASLARPTIGVVINAAPAHLEGFGSLDKVAQAKGELFAQLAAGDIAIINADDPYASLWQELAGNATVIRFGASAEYAYGDIDESATPDDAAIAFTLTTPAGSRRIHLTLAGRHNVINATAAAAAACAAGATLDDVVTGLATLRGVPGRLQVHRARTGLRVIDDTYNANPASTEAALQFVVAAGNDAWLVLGDMGELGDDAPALHAAVGRRARQLGIARIYAVGMLSQAAVSAFGPGARWFEEPEALIEALRNDASADVTLLVKGSRAARLERVVQALLDEPSPANTLHPSRRRP